jgi:glycosyltransferase involved in cell wall biosynthesis
MIEPAQVSCVIPYAGAAKYLSQVVGSAVAQHFGEILIVNDGCPPEQLAPIAGWPGIRLLHLPKSVGCPNARNIGLKACANSYVVLLDHDDLLCDGYLRSITRWVTQKQLRCAAATLRYIGENPRRVGALVSRQPDFFMPSGFFSELSLVAEVGHFPDSYGDDLLFFRAIGKATSLTTCPDARVLYRIHPQAESSRNTKAWWAISQLLPLYFEGTHTLPEINGIAREYATLGTVPKGMELQLRGEQAAAVRLMARSAYACWLNQDWVGLARFAFKLVRHAPRLGQLAKYKWSRR